MKKIFTLMTAAVMVFTANAKDFTENLTVTFGSLVTTQEQVVSVEEVENSDGLYNISISDFTFSEGDTKIEVGDIELNNVKGNSDTDGFVNFEKTETTISFMKATVILNDGSRMKGDKLYLDLDISALLGAIKVDVVVGDNNFTTTGIDKVTTTTDNGVEAIYDLNGCKLNEMQKGINIVRKADGTTVKVLKK